MSGTRGSPASAWTAFPEPWLREIYSDLTPADWELCQDAIRALAALTAAERAHVSMWMTTQ